MACLAGSLDALGGQDLKSRFGPAVLDRLTPLLIAGNRLSA